jgi:hypothetical protein
MVQNTAISIIMDAITAEVNNQSSQNNSRSFS